MHLSYHWLRELVGTDLDPEALARKLTGAGCAVEETEAVGDDTRLVAEITSNRPDWLGHHGVAREIAALTGAPVRFPEWELDEAGPSVEELTGVAVEADELCPRYTARVLRGATVKESPPWLRKRLEAVGLRPINNVVDVTNLVLMEMNQPLHAFDLARLEGRRIVVRRARDGERLAAIDGTDCRLTPAMLVIADAARPVAVAGVMGGARTEVTEGTTEILLESAYFQPAQVRRTSRALRLRSESSYRFERGIDPGGVERASARAAALLQELAGGELASGVIDTAPALAEPVEVTMRHARCGKLLGRDVARERSVAILDALGFEILRDEEEAVAVRVPTYRQDVTREADLIEEVARVEGYDTVPEAITMHLRRSSLPPSVSAARTAREVLVGLGYHECLTDTFVPADWIGDLEAGTPRPRRIVNPVNAERPVLRTALAPSLLEARRVNREAEEVRLFELNPAYGGPEETPQSLRLALLDDRGAAWVRGALEAVVEALRLEESLSVEPESTAVRGLDPAGTGRVLLGGEAIGRFGVLDERLEKKHDLTLRPAVLEIGFDPVARAARRRRVFRPLPRFPGMRRDIALVVPEAVRWAEVEALVREAAELLEGLDVESVYRGKGLEPGTKSIAFRLHLRAPERSLTDEEANAIRDRVVGELTGRIGGASLRG